MTDSLTVCFMQNIKNLYVHKSFIRQSTCLLEFLSHFNRHNYKQKSHYEKKLGCKIPEDSQIRSYRERLYSHKRLGPKLSSLLSSQNPSSPRTHSSEEEGNGEKKAKKKRLKRRHVKQGLPMLCIYAKRVQNNSVISQVL